MTTVCCQLCSVIFAAFLSAIVNSFIIQDVKCAYSNLYKCFERVTNIVALSSTHYTAVDAKWFVCVCMCARRKYAVAHLRFVNNNGK
jgi:hypothetical protein